MKTILMTNKNLLSTAAQNNNLTARQCFYMTKNIADLSTKLLTTVEADKIAQDEVFAILPTLN